MNPPAAAPRHADPRAAALVAMFESMAPADLDRLDTFYTPDATFKDPFNQVRGTAAIRVIFEHMFRTLHAPRFVVHDVLVDGAQCFLTWDFLFTPRGRPGPAWVVRGSSHLRFAADGRIDMHRDYWDVAEELYEKIPLLGGLMRWLKKRASSG